MELWQKITGNIIPSPHEPSPDGATAGPLVIGPASVDTLTIGPGDRQAIVIGPNEAIQVKPVKEIVIQPPPRGLWDERGWTAEQQHGQRYFQGFYQANHRRSGQRQTWAGRILVRGNEVQLYIADPPERLNRHPKWPCFHHEAGHWFRLNWHRAAHNIDDAILYMERILDEVINQH